MNFEEVYSSDGLIAVYFIVSEGAGEQKRKANPGGIHPWILEQCAEEM